MAAPAAQPSKGHVLFLAGMAAGLVAGIPLTLIGADAVRRRQRRHATPPAGKRQPRGSQAPARQQRKNAPRKGAQLAPRRTVIEANAVAWLEEQGDFPDGAYVITGMPDMVEAVPTSQAGGALSLAEYSNWMQDVATSIFRRLAPGACAIFMQSDIKVGGSSAGNYAEWVDKSVLLQCAAQRVDGVRLLWHKIAAFDELGVVCSLNRSRYSHLLCFCKGTSPEPHDGPVASVPDVGRRGYVTWARGAGVRCCLSLCRFAKKRGCTLVIDPFCGEGAILAMAGHCGLDSLGVELSRKRADMARRLDGADLIAKDKAEADAEMSGHEEPARATA